ncbi:MAG: hypothetical protein ACYSUI_23745 [Planctomycetota bacterium]|jgi:flagellar basal body-associated protein FliL
MPDEETVAPQSPKSKKLVGILIVAAIMLLEGAGIYAAMKLLGSGPDDVIASDKGQGAGDSADQGQRVEQSEVLIAETDASNNMSGRLLVYHIEVSALVTTAEQDRLVRLIEERQATIKDRINVVIRGADPQHLNEPGLKTIRRQIQFELNNIFEDDSLILELLIPKLMQSRGRL